MGGGELVLNFMSFEGGSRLDLGGYFLVSLQLAIGQGTQVMGNTRGDSACKSWLFLNRSNVPTWYGMVHT